MGHVMSLKCSRPIQSPPANMLSRLFLTILVASASFSVGANARQVKKSEIHARQTEAAKRWHSASPPVKRAGPKNITFSNPKASRESF